MEASDFSLLVSLDALLQEQSVSGAARRLGLSTPAVSHILARVREKFQDPILVRVGRGMALTPRGEELRPRIRALIEDGTRLLEQEQSFDPLTIQRTFTIHATDHVLLVLGPVLARRLQEFAPGVVLRYLPSASDDWKALREGTADLSICLPGHYPDEFLTRHLFTDEFVCVVSAHHPSVRDSLTWDDYLALEHLVVSPLGYPSAVEGLLRERGVSRTIRATVPFFLTGLHMLTHTPTVLTVSKRAALALQDAFQLRVFPPPMPIPGYALNLLWHPRVDSDPQNRWLREQFLLAARLTEPA